MRAKALLSVLLLLATALVAQGPRGVRPLKPKPPPQASTTRAVVVGISEYQHTNIPALKYAHRDAHAFAEWLESPTGGTVPKANIHLLVNEQATSAAFCIALEWLISESRAGDRAIIYFAGHADVETSTMHQNGYLLCYDSPAAVYAAGAIPLQYLQAVITTLCTKKEARTLLIADACHVGKLAGSSTGGPELTNANLAQQYAKEAKILSCQPEEYSIEGPQWGDGRGVFSYYLLKGLSGAADDDCNGTVTLYEIGAYLQKVVPAETAPHVQIPITIGNLITPISLVGTPLSPLVQPPFGKDGGFMRPKGKDEVAEDSVQIILEQARPAMQQLYGQFLKALEQGVLIHPAAGQPCARDLFQQLAKEPVFEPLKDQLQRALLLAMLNEMQQTLNALLELEPGLADRWQFHPERISEYPEYLAYALELVPDRSGMYNSLMAKKMFFEAYNIALSIKDNPVELHDPLKRVARQKLILGLQYEADAPYLYYLIGNTWLFTSDGDSSQYYFNKAVDLAPSWVLPYLELTYDYVDTRDDNPMVEMRIHNTGSMDSNGQYYLRFGNGMAWYKMQEYAAAEQEFFNCLRLEQPPRRYQYLAFTMLAHIAHKSGNSRKAGQYVQLAQLFL